MDIKIIEQPIKKKEIQEIARSLYGNFVKAVVDIERKVMAIGGEFHADEEALLLQHGSKQENLWGINLYVEKSEGDWIEFDSMVNVRPSQNNNSRSVEEHSLREKIRIIVNSLVQ